MRLLLCMVTDCPYQVDILAVLTNPRERSHAFSGMPTGCGKSLPQMLISLLSPKGEQGIK